MTRPLRLQPQGRQLQRRVPLAQKWLAQMLNWQGHSTANIARTLQISDVSVQRMPQLLPQTGKVE